MPLSDDERKQFEELERKAKEPAHSAHSLVIHIGGDSGMSIAEAVKRGYLTELEAEKLEEEEEDKGKGKRKSSSKDDDDEGETPPKRRGYFKEEA